MDHSPLKISVTNRHVCSIPLTEQICRMAALDELRPDLLILREKDLTESEYKFLAEEVLSLCEELRLPCALHSYIDVARRLGAARIHLPLPLLKEHPNAAEEFSAVGVSVHSAEEAIFAEEHGASYLISGHIFPTDCKKGIAPRGLAFLNEVCNAVSIPVYAIGGITPERIPQVLEGCDAAAGVCMMSYYMKV